VLEAGDPQVIADGDEAEGRPADREGVGHPQGLDVDARDRRVLLVDRPERVVATRDAARVVADAGGARDLARRPVETVDGVRLGVGDPEPFLKRPIPMALRFPAKR